MEYLVDIDFGALFHRLQGILILGRDTVKYLSTPKLINKSIQTTANEKKAILTINIPKPKWFVFVNRINSFLDEIGHVYVELRGPE